MNSAFGADEKVIGRVIVRRHAYNETDGHSSNNIYPGQSIRGLEKVISLSNLRMRLNIILSHGVAFCQCNINITNFII